MGLRSLLGLPPKLPPWASWETPDRIAVDCATAYPRYLELLEPQLGATVDRFALEVARRCITLDLKTTVKAQAPRRTEPLVLHFVDPARRWSLKGFPEGRGADVGAEGFQPFWQALPADRLA